MAVARDAQAVKLKLTRTARRIIMRTTSPETKTQEIQQMTEWITGREVAKIIGINHRNVPQAVKRRKIKIRCKRGSDVGMKPIGGVATNFYVYSRNDVEDWYDSINNIVEHVELTHVEKLRNFVMSKTWDTKGLTGLQNLTS